VSTTPTDDAIVSEITIKAPAARVFAAFADPQQRLQWWRAGGRFTPQHAESDLRAGGSFLMQFDSGGHPASIRGIYRRVDAPRLLEFTWLPSWDDGAAATIVLLELTEHDGVTTVRLTHSGFKSDESRARHRGWPELLQSLRAYVEG